MADGLRGQLLPAVAATAAGVIVSVSAVEKGGFGMVRGVPAPAGLGLRCSSSVASASRACRYLLVIGSCPRSPPHPHSLLAPTGTRQTVTEVTSVTVFLCDVFTYLTSEHGPAGAGTTALEPAVGSQLSVVSADARTQLAACRRALLTDDGLRRLFKLVSVDKLGVAAAAVLRVRVPGHPSLPPFPLASRSSILVCPVPVALASP